MRYTDPTGHRLDPGGDDGGLPEPELGFDDSLGGNVEENPPKWAGVVMGGVLTVSGTGITLVGLVAAAHGEPAGFFVAGAGGLLAVLGAEVAYVSLGDLRPLSWPEHLPIILNLP